MLHFSVQFIDSYVNPVHKSIHSSFDDRPVVKSANNSCFCGPNIVAAGQWTRTSNFLQISIYAWHLWLTCWRSQPDKEIKTATLRHRLSSPACCVRYVAAKANHPTAELEYGPTMQFMAQCVGVQFTIWIAEEEEEEELKYWHYHNPLFAYGLIPLFIYHRKRSFLISISKSLPGTPLHDTH